MLLVLVNHLLDLLHVLLLDELPFVALSFQGVRSTTSCVAVLVIVRGCLLLMLGKHSLVVVGDVLLVGVV